MIGRNLTVVIIVLVILAGGWWLLNSKQAGSAIPTPSLINQPDESISPATTSTTASEITVSITKDGFNPQQTTIKAGETVTWANDDNANHTVNSSGHPTHLAYPPLNTVDVIKPGEKKSLSFPEPGTYEYHDHLNPTLFGSVTVE